MLAPFSFMGGAIDPDAQAFINAAGITNSVQINAINTLVVSMKTQGLWSKMKAVYPFVTDNRNLLDYTEDFGNAVWAKNDSTVTTNTTLAPNGTLTADTLSDGTTNASHYVSTVKTAFGQNGNNTSTIYAKANTLNYLWMYFYNGSESVGVSAWFNLSNGTVGTVQSGLTASIENAGNGWYRCSITRNFNLTAANSNCGYGVSNADNVASYLGTNKSLYIWGAQLEIVSTATTYQPIATTQQAFISNQFKYNLVNPVDSDAAFRLVFNGGWTHSANGATPNGTNAFADTKLIPSTSLSLNSASIGYYSRTNSAISSEIAMGILNGFTGGNGLNLVIRRDTNLNSFRATETGGANGLVNSTSTDSRGLTSGSITSSTSRKLYKNGTLLATNSSNYTWDRASNSVMIAAAYNIGNSLVEFYTNKECAFSYISDGLSDTEAANLYTAVQAFQTALNRQV